MTQVLISKVRREILFRHWFLDDELIHHHRTCASCHHQLPVGFLNSPKSIQLPRTWKHPRSPYRIFLGCISRASEMIIDRSRMWGFYILGGLVLSSIGPLFFLIVSYLQINWMQIVQLAYFPLIPIYGLVGFAFYWSGIVLLALSED